LYQRKLTQLIEATNQDDSKLRLCLQCGQLFQFRPSGAKNNAKRVLCSNHCAAKWRMANGAGEKIIPALLAGQRKAAEARRGIPSPSTAQRMRERNPMRSEEARRKMAASLAGRTFLARGGNGKLTRQQIALHEATGYPVEHVICTRPVWGRFPSLPNHYKVDLADPSRRLAIEVDGKTHRLKKWRFLDARKTEVLRALGWSVLRVKNEEVDADISAVLARIASFTA